MRRTVPGIVLVLCLLAAGCGDDAQPRGPEPRVRLAVTIPQDGATVRARTVAVEGTVEPAGSLVQVLGEEVPVDAGREPADVLRSACVLVRLDGSAGERPDTPGAPAIEGSAAQVAARLHELGEAGADEVIVVADPITERSVHTLGEVLAELGHPG